MRGCMDNDPRVIPGEKLPHAGLIARVRDKRFDCQIRMKLAQLALDFEKGELGAFDQKEFLGVEACDLPGQFGTDGSSGARNHHRFPGQEGSHVLEVELHRLPAQKIFDFDIAKPVDLHFSGENLIESGIVRAFTGTSAQIETILRISSRGASRW